MKIRSGCTRVVILTGNSAIKIARIRLLREVLRAIIIPFSQKKRQHYSQKYGKRLIEAFIKSVFAGLFANRNEYRYWQETSDARVMPTTRLLLNGFIAIQERGVAVKLKQMDLENIFPGQADQLKFLDIHKPHQYCLNRHGAIVLIDYGRDDTYQFLMQQQRLAA